MLLQCIPSFAFCNKWLPFKLPLVHTNFTWRRPSMPWSGVLFVLSQVLDLWLLCSQRWICHDVSEVSEPASYDLVQYVPTFTKHGPHVFLAVHGIRNVLITHLFPNDAICFTDHTKIIHYPPLSLSCDCFAFQQFKKHTLKRTQMPEANFRTF